MKIFATMVALSLLIASTLSFGMEKGKNKTFINNISNNFKERVMINVQGSQPKMISLKPNQDTLLGSQFKLDTTGKWDNFITVNLMGTDKTIKYELPKELVGETIDLSIERSDSPEGFAVEIMEYGSEEE